MLLEFAMISPSFDMALLFPKAVQISIPRMPVTSLSAIVGRVGHDCNLVDLIWSYQRARIGTSFYFSTPCLLFSLHIQGP